MTNEEKKPLSLVNYTIHLSYIIFIDHSILGVNAFFIAYSYLWWQFCQLFYFKCQIQFKIQNFIKKKTERFDITVTGKKDHGLEVNFWL
jgi:hypothetical protein